MKTTEKNLQDINNKLGKLASFRYMFILSIVKGVGTAIGATIVTGLIIWTLSSVIQSIGGFPFLENILQNVK